MSRFDILSFLYCIVELTVAYLFTDGALAFSMSHFQCSLFVSFVLSCGQGSSFGSSTGIAQRARHPDELKREDGKWMIDIDYYLAQQVFFNRSLIKLSNNCGHLLQPFCGLIEGLVSPCRFILWYLGSVLQFKVQARSAWLIA